MTQFFDALERQLVALSRETPRMTPRARARRRVAIGTVTVLCLLACVAGSSLLPHLVNERPIGHPMLAGLARTLGPRAFGALAPPDRHGGGLAIDVGDLSGRCGHSVPVETGGYGETTDVDLSEGRMQGLVCSSGSSGGRAAARLPVACGASAGSGAVMRLVDRVMEMDWRSGGHASTSRIRRICKHLSKMLRRPAP